jgi:MEMO1 family protein
MQPDFHSGLLKYWRPANPSAAPEPTLQLRRLLDRSLSMRSPGRFRTISAAVAASLCIATLVATPIEPNDDVRLPSIAGKFYPSEPAALRASIELFVADAVQPASERPVALVVPHAGYLYSGQIAADAFRQAAGHEYQTIVILGANHTAPPFRRMAIHPGSSFRTPLGDAQIDQDVVRALVSDDGGAVLDAKPHVEEHSIEVLVPFVQTLFPGARIVPVVVGSPDLAVARRFGLSLAKVLADRQALIVASSDLSHYAASREAAAVDRATLEAIATRPPQAIPDFLASLTARGVPNLVTAACGEGPILVAMTAAAALGAERRVVISYANSGDLPVGDSARAVGYGAVAFSAGKGSDTTILSPSRPETGPLDEEDKLALLQLARETISRFLNTGTVPLPRGFSGRTRQEQGVFVTLKRRGQLRGCIGQIVSKEPLHRLVGTMALKAALEDSRFRPVRASELKDIDIEISILTTPKRVSGPNDVVVGRDGVILEKDGRSALFLPQVALEERWTRDEMLDNLSVKAGLPANSWRRGVNLFTFQADVFGEAELLGRRK